MFVALFLFCIIVVVLVTIFTLYIKWKYRHLRHIPGPTPLPIFGNFLEFDLKPTAALNDLSRLMNKYGGNGYVFKASLGIDDMHVFLADPKILEFFINSTQILKKSSEYDIIRPVMKNGLITSSGSLWQKRRKLITPTFHVKILEYFVTVNNSESDVLIKKLMKELDKDVVDISPFITAITLDIICATALGTTIGAQGNSQNEYVKAIEDISKIFAIRTFSAWKRYDFLFKFSSDYKTQTECLKIADEFARNVIEKRRNELLSENVNNTFSNQKNVKTDMKNKKVFLDSLLNSTVDGKPLSDNDIIEEVHTMLIAGHDTSASVISFAIYELSKNPNIQQKAYEELKEIFNADKDRQPTMKDLNNMTYLDLVIKEALRLYPAAPVIGRKLEEDVTYNGTTYVKGVNIIFFLFYLHRRPDLFKDPEKFDPERFANAHLISKNPYAYIPFSGGPRNCIGQKFAMYEMKCILSKVIRNFVILPADKKYNTILAFDMVLKSANGVFVNLKKRY